MDDKITSSAYVIGLYQDLESLNNHLAGYKNVLVQINPANNNLNISEHQREQIKRDTEAIRFLIIRSNIKLHSLSEKIPSFKTFVDQNKEGYTQIISAPIPTFDVLFNYVVEMNKSFITGFSADFFAKVTQIYSDYTGGYDNSSPGENNGIDNQQQ